MSTVIKKTYYEKILLNIWPINTLKKKDVQCGICDVIVQNFIADGLYSRRNLNILVKGILYLLANIGLLPFALLLRFFNIKIITGTTFFQVGEVVLLDAILKKNYLQQKRVRYLFMYHENFYDNPYLINLYQKHLVFVKNKFLLLLLIFLSYSIFLRENVVDLDTNCEKCDLSRILNTYRDKFGSPLVEIPMDDLGHLISEISEFVDVEKKFVCVHARESGYKYNLYKDEKRTTRNSNINTYETAFEFLVSKGYLIIRMGDKSMAKLTHLKEKFGNNIFDYAHSNIKSSRMDAYLFSHCEFSIVCNSGPSEIPSIFNKGIITVNGYTAVNALRFYEGDVSIFKKIQNKSTKKNINIKKLFQHPFDKPLQRHELDKFGYSLIDNSEAEILNAVKDYFNDKSNLVQIIPSVRFTPPLLSSHFACGTKARYAERFINEYIENQEGELQ